MNKNVAEMVSANVKAAAALVLADPLMSAVGDENSWAWRELQNVVTDTTKSAFNVTLYRGAASVTLYYDGDACWSKSTIRDDGSTWRAVVSKAHVSWSSFSDESLEEAMGRVAFYNEVIALAAKLPATFNEVCVETAEEAAEKATIREKEALARDTDRKLRKAAEFVRKAMRIGSIRAIPAELLVGVKSGDYNLTFRDYGGKEYRDYTITVWVGGGNGTIVRKG